MDSIRQILADVYYNLDSPAAYAGEPAVYREARKRLPKIKRKQVQKWLTEQLTHSLHRPAKYKFRRRRITVPTIDRQWQIDLADLQSLRKHNNNNGYLLTCIDVFSR